MPLYEYECEQCHKRVEKRQKFSDAQLTVCPTCGGKLERTITAPAFQFSGGGWYKDGYGSAKPAATASEGGTPAASGDAKPAGAAAAESAPAAAAPTAAAAPAPSPAVTASKT